MCNFDADIREVIDEEIMLGRGPKYLAKKYPHLDIKIHNVYSHKKHIVEKRAAELYERALEEKAQRNKEARQANKPVNEEVRYVQVSTTSDFDKEGIKRTMSGSLPIPPHVDDLLEVTNPHGIRNLAERLETTGIWWQDSINILDVFIAEGSTPEMLEKLTPKDVLMAIDKKAEMMEKYGGADKHKDIEEENTKISSILHVMNEKEQGRIDEGAVKKLLEVLLADDEKVEEVGKVGLGDDEEDEIEVLDDSGY